MRGLQARVECTSLRYTNAVCDMGVCSTHRLDASAGEMCVIADRCSLHQADVRVPADKSCVQWHSRMDRKENAYRRIRLIAINKLRAGSVWHTLYSLARRLAKDCASADTPGLLRARLTTLPSFVFWKEAVARGSNSPLYKPRVSA